MIQIRLEFAFWDLIDFILENEKLLNQSDFCKLHNGQNPSVISLIGFQTPG